MHKGQYPGLVKRTYAWNLSYYEYHQFLNSSPDAQEIDVQFLSSTLSDRIKPGTLRATAKQLGVSPITLCRMVHGKLPYKVTVIEGKPQKQLDLETVLHILLWLYTQ